MSIIGKLYDKTKLFLEGGVDLDDIRLDVLSYAANFSKSQRSRRRDLFPAERLVCGPISAEESLAYRRFLSRHPLAFRKGVGAGYFPELIRALGPEHLYHVARFGGEIIGSVRMHRACIAGGMRFWFVSEVYVAREFHGKGVGERLIRSIIAKASGANEVLYLTVNSQHFKAANLYKKIGFREDENLRDIVVRELYDSIYRGKATFLFKRAA